ncbi:MAG: rhodanese-related sulfurtransferase [Candidatus Levybacteria bacterium]|nr:rhodanese-related sulfurtransferase [Candidatus Levybacteria bacterium]
MKKSKYQVLLYYKYVTIDIPEKVREEQRKLCQSLNLKGRIIVASEGINGTVEGLTHDTEKYIAAMEKSEYFKGIHFKKSAGTGDAFPKLSVKARKEVVTAHLLDLNPNEVTGAYITADQLHAWFESKKEFYIVDMRNDYEYISGHFEGFIPSGLHNFFDLADVLPKIAHLKDKTIVTVCTGGIRCEKASGFLVTNGFKDVYQLQDGIQTYMEKYPNKHFKGKLYVFDNRLTLGFNTESPDHEVVGTCYYCGVASDTYVNCHYDLCHYHHISCANCLDSETGLAFCKPECKENYIKIQKPREEAKKQNRSRASFTS